MAIIEDPFNGDVVDIGVLQAEHLGLLKRAHPAMRAGHEDPDPFFTAHGVFGRAAGVTRGGAQNIEFLSPASQLIFKQMTQQLHGHVFERQGGAVGEGQDKHPRLQRPQGRDFGGAKHFNRIGFFTQSQQVCWRYVVYVKRQDFKSQLRVTLVCINASPLLQGLRADPRISHRQIQATVGCQAFQQDIAKTPLLRVTTGR